MDNRIDKLAWRKFVWNFKFIGGSVKESLKIIFSPLHPDLQSHHLTSMQSSLLTGLLLTSGLTFLILNITPCERPALLTP